MAHRPRKRFSQNFLCDKSYVRRILQAAELGPGIRVLEIGPGQGALTQQMLTAGAQVTAWEVDRDLAEFLSQWSEPNLNVSNVDALAVAWPDLLSQPPYRLVANLPYHISSPLLFKLLEQRHLFERGVLMLQKEVAQRLCATPRTSAYGAISVLFGLWFDVDWVCTVPPDAFRPRPQVDSAVLLMRPLAQPREQVPEALFTQVVKGSFQQRRKTLRNSLQAAGWPQKEVLAALEEAHIASSQRPEELDVAAFARLSRSLGPVTSL